MVIGRTATGGMAEKLVGFAILLCLALPRADVCIQLVGTYTHSIELKGMRALVQHEQLMQNAFRCFAHGSAKLFHFLKEKNQEYRNFQHFWNRPLPPHI
jgi:hypothetical protein